MKQKLWLVALVVALAVGGNAAWADGDFYVIAGGGAVGTKISSVPYTITQSGFYYLAGNLTYSGTGNAIAVNANDVTIDLMGFSLTKSGSPPTGTGINLFGNNVEVRNGTVRGFMNGINANSSGSANHRIINLRGYGNNLGVGLVGRGHLVKNCTFSDGTDGIVLQGGTVSGCLVQNHLLRGITNVGTGIVLNNTCIANGLNFSLGTGDNNVPIIVDGNSAYGGTPGSPNYYIAAGCTGVVITAHNAGTP